MPRRPCLGPPGSQGCPTCSLAEPGKPRCCSCQAVADADKWQRNPNRDRTYRALRETVAARLPVDCAICGEPITHVGHDAEALTLDHIDPWSSSGNNAPANLRPAHKRCNSARGGSHRN